MTYRGAVIGIQARGLAGAERPHRTVEAMAIDYLEEVKARQPEGPYYLCGYSFGSEGSSHSKWRVGFGSREMKSVWSAFSIR
jgi:hypothetical protein